MRIARRITGGVILAVLATGVGVRGTETITVRDDGARVTIRTPLYRAVVSREDGCTLRELTDTRGKRSYPVSRAGLEIVEERERATWSGAGFGQPVKHGERAAAATLTMERGTESVVCSSRWSCAAATVSRTLVFRAASAVIDIDYVIRVLRPLEEISYVFQVDDVRLNREGVFFPGRRQRIAREPGEARFERAPGYAYRWDGRSGIGMLCAGGQHGEMGSYAFATLPPGVPCTVFACHSPALRWRKPPYEFHFGTSIVVGGTPADVAALYREACPNLAPVEIADLDIGKLLYRAGESGQAQVVLRNHTGIPRPVVVEAGIESGLGTVRPLPEQRRTVPPYSDLALTLRWPNRSEWGFALRVLCRDDRGARLDTVREYFGVADHFVNLGQTTVWNAGWMRYDWLIPGQVERARRNYIGIVEYYCWAPDQVFDLTPDTENFEPHTESQASYRTRLTRTFLRSLVDAAHAKGLRVLAMDTGFTSLDGALDHPKGVKYTRDGQIYLYNGNVVDGKRFDAVGAHVFTPSAIRAWAEEMNASVAMFGWDGVRFDWNFIPIANQDPRFLAAGGSKKDPYRAARQQSWYTFDGTSAHELFPAPDKSAAAFCRLWRSTVTAKYPDFSYNVNYTPGNSGIGAEFPEYTKVNCRDAGVLMESLLDVAVKYPTWQQWAGALTRNARLVRRLRGQPFVGWMRGYAPGGIAHRNLQYIMMAAGFRWYGPYGARNSLDDTADRFRHALRFAEYFYDPDFRFQDDVDALLTLRGEGVDRVLWKPFVFERRRGSSREILVHLLNLPPDDHILMHHPVPVPKRDLVITVHVGVGAEPQAAWLLVPQPVPHAVPLRFRRGDRSGDVVVTIPELVSLGSLVLQLQRGSVP